MSKPKPSASAPLFRSASRRLSDCIKVSFREPVMWLLLAVCAVSLFFDRAAVGAVCAVLVLLRCVLCALCRRFAEETDAAMEAWDEPLCRVLRTRRDGRNPQIVRMRADRLTPGDEIFLRRGDIVPADATLLTSSGLVVSERPIQAAKDAGEAVLLEKDANAAPTDGRGDVSPAHMVYAGGVVVQGRAHARVTAVGGDTHLGAMTGGLAPAHPRRTPELFLRAKRVLSVWNLILAFLILPITVIGILTLGRRFDLLDLFLVSLALAVVSLGEQMISLGQLVGARQRAVAAADRDRDNSAHIKTSVGLERLSQMTDLVLLGTGALHDGRAVPETVITVDRSYTVGRTEPDEAARRLAEWVYIYRRAAESLPVADDRPLVGEDMLALADALCTWAQPDTEALLLRITQLASDGAWVTASFGSGERVHLLVTDDHLAFDDCTLAATAEGIESLDPTGRDALYRAWRQAVRTGYRVCFVISERDGERCAEGMIASAPRVSPKIKGCIRALESAGVRVVACLRDVSDENARVLGLAGLADAAPAVRLGTQERVLSVAACVAGGVRALEGCTSDHVADYIRDRQAHGACVGVLSVEAEDLPLLNLADIAITCAPAWDGFARRGQTTRPSSGLRTDGTPDADCATDLCRRRADVIVRRSTATGGGVCGVRRALLAARQMRQALRSAVRFLMVSQLLRLVAVLLPLCLGLTLIPATAVLLSGLIVDLAGVLCYAHADLPPEPGDRAGIGAGLDRPHLTFRWDLIAAAVSAVLPWAVVAVASHLNVVFGADTAYFAFLSLLGTQLVLLLTGNPPRHGRATFTVVLLFLCLYAGTLAAALSAGMRVIWCLVLPALQPVTFLTGHLVGRLIGDITKR